MLARVRRVSRGLGDRCEPARPAAGSRTCAAASKLLREQNVLLFDGLLKIALAEAEAAAGDPDRASPSSTKRWRRATAPATARSKPNCIGSRGEILLKRDPANPAPAEEALPDRHRRRKAARRRAASNCARRLRWPSSTNRPAAPPKPTPSSRRRSKALRRRSEMPEIAEAQALLAALAADRRGQSGGRASAATDAVARLLRQRAHCRARLRRAGNDRGVRQSPRVGGRRQGRAGAVVGRLRLMGRQLHARRVAVDAGARSGPSSATSRRDPIRPRPASPIAPPERLAGSPASIAKRGITWNGRSPCSNPAATTIWRSVSDRTQASPRWLILRLYCGLSARSIARRRSCRGCWRGSRPSRMATRSPSDTCSRPICIDARRPHEGDANSWSLLESPARTICPCAARSECFSMAGRWPRATARRARRHAPRRRQLARAEHPDF